MLERSGKHKLKKNWKKRKERVERKREDEMRNRNDCEEKPEMIIKEKSFNLGLPSLPYEMET